MNPIPVCGPTDSSARRRRIATRFAVLLAALLNAATPLAADDRASIRPKFSPTERMHTDHLKATHEDARQIRKSRRVVDPIPGRNDYRAILHAHAEDSAHTGGTRAEMLADAKKAGVNAILLTDHHRPPKDFITDSWRGIREGVLFVPGSEHRGFLIYPTHSILDRMNEPTPKFIESVKADGGLIFLSHIEERPDHPMAGLDGMEITNRHADAKNDPGGLLNIVLKLTDPESLKQLETDLANYPDELFASQVEYPTVYIAKWDAETKARRLTGVAANDCHHNQILIVKVVDAETVRVGTNVDADDKMRLVSAKLRPGVRALTKDRKPGDVIARLDFDPYHRSFRNASTHILAPRLEESAVREALRNGHAYVSHDWICDPSGFRFELRRAKAEKPDAIMGDEVERKPGDMLFAEFPARSRIRLMRDGKAIADATGLALAYAIEEPGVYRAEGWLTLDGEDRPWVYSNPIYVR